jgi:uncharacterized protein YjbI with pentapeptide repeats
MGTLGLALAAVLLLLVVWHLPAEILKRLETRHNERLGFERGLALETELRKVIAMVCLGLLLLAGLFHSWEQLAQTRHESQVRAERAERQLHGERYTHAVEMLASPDELTRIGGIHAMTALAHTEDARTHGAAIQTLTAFVRETAGGTTCRAGALVDHAPPTMEQDIRSALFSLSARIAPEDDAGLGMRRIGLRGVDLPAATLRGPLADWILWEACLHGADLLRADLRGANLRRADLSMAQLHATTLDATTQLQDANVSGACFAGATFEGQPAGMSWATLFAEACVRGSELPGDVRVPASKPCERCPGGGR